MVIKLKKEYQEFLNTRIKELTLSKARSGFEWVDDNDSSPHHSYFKTKEELFKTCQT